MKKYNIHNKSNSELLGNLSDGEEFWNAEYLDIARNELLERGLTESQIDEMVEELGKQELLRIEQEKIEYQEWLTNNKTENYTSKEMLLLFLLGPLNLASQYSWDFDHSYFSLIKYKYHQKLLTKTIIILISSLLYWYALMLLIQYT